MSFINVANIIHKRSMGALLVKVNIEAACRLVPIHPKNCIQQDLEWNGELHVDICLPLRLRYEII